MRHGWFKESYERNYTLGKTVSLTSLRQIRIICSISLGHLRYAACNNSLEQVAAGNVTFTRDTVLKLFNLDGSYRKAKLASE